MDFEICFALVCKLFCPGKQNKQISKTSSSFCWKFFKLFACTTRLVLQRYNKNNITLCGNFSVTLCCFFVCSFIDFSSRSCSFCNNITTKPLSMLTRYVRRCLLALPYMFCQSQSQCEKPVSHSQSQCEKSSHSNLRSIAQLFLRYCANHKDKQRRKGKELHWNKQRWKDKGLTS